MLDIIGELYYNCHSLSSYESIGLVRMIHRLGGPERLVNVYRNGQCFFIYWPLNGMIRIVNKTGQLWDSRNSPWKVHPDDLRQLTLGFSPITITKPSIKKVKD